MPIVYAAITNHGFGHATRMAAVLAAIRQRCPDVLMILTTTAPRWLLESYLPGDFIQRPRAFDVGVIQADSITMDQEATRLKLEEIRAKQTQIIAGEVSFIRQNKVDLVLADIPPLAAPIAHYAEIPCWMISNFGWDFIYRPWGDSFREITDWIEDCFHECDRLFRLPFHEPMSAFQNQMDVGLTGGSPRYSEQTLREQLQIKTPIDRTILLTFGGLSLQAIPYQNLVHFPNWQFITFDQNAPDLENLIKITSHDFRPVDLMPICHAVISKPGYGTFSEACRLGVPVITITREGFAETPLLLEGIQDYATHRILSPADFFAGPWDFLEQPLNSPRCADCLSSDGNETIATAVVNYLQSL
jgi:hypothetical protein